MCMFVLFQAEDGIRYRVRSRGLGDVYKRQVERRPGPVERLVDAQRLQAAGRGDLLEQVADHGLSLIHI